jgi:hypothetical protein
MLSKSGMSAVSKIQPKTCQSAHPDQTRLLAIHNIPIKNVSMKTAVRKSLRATVLRCDFRSCAWIIARQVCLDRSIQAL